MQRVFLILLLVIIPSSAVFSQPADTLSQRFFNGQYGVQPSAYGTENFNAGTLPTVTLNPAEYSQEPFASSALSPVNGNNELYLSSIPGKRSGMFQKANANVLWSPKAGGHRGLGLTQVDLSATFAFPLPTADSPCVITPLFNSYFFDPKISSNGFYTTGLDFRWIRPVIKDKLTLDLGVGAYYSGDFEVSGSDAMRYPAHLAAAWQCNPRLKIIFGVAYLDRDDDYNWFPMAGLIWTPNEDVSIELVAPRLRIAQRIRWFGSAAGDTVSDWLYTGFEFGGGSWGAKVGGNSVNIDYSDLRLLLGYERKLSNGLTFGLELGYMFNRHLETANRYDVHVDDTLFLRLRTAF
jgi:hypothetical protein